MEKRFIPAVFIFILILIYLSGCGSIARLRHENKLDAYKGDGQINLRYRDYGIGKTYGYKIDLQEFIAEKTLTKTYSLKKLPVFDRVKVAQVELFTFFPPKPMSIDQANELYQRLPESHNVKIKLYDSQSGEIFYSVDNKINSLKGSNARGSGFDRANFVKNLFTIEFDKIKSTENLMIDFTYDIGNEPVSNKMLLIVIADAPLA